MYDYTHSPIRSLDRNIENKLLIINPTSSSLWSTCIKGNLVRINRKPETDPNKDLGPGYSPSGKFIRCPMQFLDFMWCSCFYWLVSEEESQATLIRDPHATFLSFRSQALCAYYNSIFDHMDWIIQRNDSNIWPAGMYSPAYLPANTPTEIKEYILKANSLYSTAIVFLLSHEIGHFLLGHQDYSQTDQAYNINMEGDADQFALELVFSDNPQGVDRLNRTYGCILGLLSCLHLSRASKNLNGCILDNCHPPLQNRVEHIIQYAIPSSGRVINGISTDKEYFYHMISQTFDFYLYKLFNVQLPSYDAGSNCEQYFHDILPVIDQYIHS